MSPGRRRTWSLAAWLFGAIALALLVLPVWAYGDDSGWYSCGPLWNKADGRSLGCEYAGTYRTRLWWVFAVALLAFGALGMAWWRTRAERRQDWWLLGAGVFVAAGLAGLLWADNDAVYEPSVYDFGATSFEIRPVARVEPIGDETAPSYRLEVSARGWPSASTAMFVACRSSAVPDSCDLTYSSGDVVRADADGTIDAEVDLRVPDGTTLVAGFDGEQVDVADRPWPAGTYVTAPTDPSMRSGDLPVVDHFADPPRVAGAPSTTVLDPSGGPASSVRPAGFDRTAARATLADGTTCDLCVWLAETPEDRARGLMGVTDLGAADAMAFVYPEAHTGSFWMKDTVMPLSIAFFAPSGEFLDAFEMEPCTTEQCATYPTPADFLIAVEAPRGGLDELGLVAGSTLELLDLPCDD